jgi:hypothetical protein
LRLRDDIRGSVATPFGLMAASVASLFVGGLLFAGQYGGDMYEHVVRTLQQSLGI